MLLNVLFVFALTAALLLFSDVLLTDSHKEGIGKSIKQAADWANRRHAKLVTYDETTEEPKIRWDSTAILIVLVTDVVAAIILAVFFRYPWLLGYFLAPKETFLKDLSIIFGLPLGIGIAMIAMGVIYIVGYAITFTFLAIVDFGIIFTMLASYVLTRISEYQKGPLAAVSALVAGAIALFKLFSG
jgi:hypothetical protein